LIRDHEAVDESRARRLETEGRHGRNSELFLQQAGDVRENEIGRRRSDEHEIDLGRLQPGVIDRRARGVLFEIALRFVLRRDVAPLDARAGPDPLI
jgi:hypothetical protein